MNLELFQDACSAIGVKLTLEMASSFEDFEDKLYAANEVMNLTRVPRDECWLRHFVDSLLFHDLIPVGASLLDIGAGPGFPAWPIALVRPDLQVVAVDSSGKVIRFLQQNPLPNLKALQVRAEDWQMREAFDFVTGRAVAPLGIQLELSAPHCKLGGMVMPMRTPAESDQMKMDAGILGLQLDEVIERRLPGTDVIRAFPQFRKVAPTPKRFPRAWADMKRKPLLELPL